MNQIISQIETIFKNSFICAERRGGKRENLAKKQILRQRYRKLVLQNPIPEIFSLSIIISQASSSSFKTLNTTYPTTRHHYQIANMHLKSTWTKLNSGFFSLLPCPPQICFFPSLLSMIMYENSTLRAA